MRKKRTRHGLTVNAIAGTNVVYFGLDLAAKQRKGCLGFAIQREDHDEDERAWMRGMKTFQATEPNPDPGVTVASRSHPFQTYQWADYTAKPGHTYTYTTFPLYGQPHALEEGKAVSVRVTTEQEEDGVHSVYFNRGAVASQEYTRRFQDRTPDEVGEHAYEWLSRGLLEALQRFIGRADGKRFGLYAAIYEFQWPAVLEAVRAAAKSGAKVKIVFDAIEGRGPRDKNIKAITQGKIKGLCIERTVGTIMHNKFFVLTEDGEPVAVWTGSTNLTENGIFGHSNCGHVVEDPDIASAYLAYWGSLRKDPTTANSKLWCATNNAAPPKPWKDDTTVVFSPRGSLDVLEWYRTIAASAKKGLFMTFAFGMPKFYDVFDRKDDVLRFALLEKESNNNIDEARRILTRIRRRPNVVMAIGNHIKLNNFDRWLKEIDRVNPHVHVRWIHTKYMLVDPLGPKPIVVSGSANFSEASTKRNDENMLVIRNDRRIADIYFGEFMRLHAHYAFREAVARAEQNNEEWSPKYLIPDDGWQRDYFKIGTARSRRREYFAGKA